VKHAVRESKYLESRQLTGPRSEIFGFPSDARNPWTEISGVPRKAQRPRTRIFGFPSDVRRWLHDPLPAEKREEKTRKIFRADQPSAAATDHDEEINKRTRRRAWQLT